MVRWASTWVLLELQESLPNPFSKTAAPFLPTTTEAPGYPPALIPRSTTRSMAARRELDMPTSVGDLTGRPSPARVIVRAVRMTLSNANSLDYLNLYGRQLPEVPTGRSLPPARWNGVAYGCKRFPRAKVTAFWAEIPRNSRKLQLPLW